YGCVLLLVRPDEAGTLWPRLLCRHGYGLQAAEGRQGCDEVRWSDTFRSHLRFARRRPYLSTARQLDEAGAAGDRAVHRRVTFRRGRSKIARLRRADRSARRRTMSGDRISVDPLRPDGLAMG